MENSDIYIPVTAVQDESSHWYLIPSHLSKRFNTLENKIIESNFDEDLIDAFESEFGQYRTGGGINNTQLYIKSNQ